MIKCIELSSDAKELFNIPLGWLRTGSFQLERNDLNSMVINIILYIRGF
jgi:hypothetical protein